MKKRILLAAVVIVLAQTSAQASEANANCPAKKLLPALDYAYHECSNGFVNGSCEDFVSTFQELVPRSDCQRSFDTAPVPAIWLAGSAAFGDYLRLISRLVKNDDKVLTDESFAKARYMARYFFGSNEFRSILDGHYAEEYLDQSKQVERKLQVPK